MRELWNSFSSWFTWPVIMQGVIANLLWQLIFWSIRSAYKNRETIRGSVQTGHSLVSRVLTNHANAILASLLGSVVNTFLVLLMVKYKLEINQLVNRITSHIPPQVQYVLFVVIIGITIALWVYIDKKEKEEKLREEQRIYPITWELKKLQAMKCKSAALRTKKFLVR